MKINCLHCGHAFGVDDAYCDYEGFLKCPTCAGMLEARIQDGMIRSVRPGNFTSATIEPAPAPSPVARTPMASPHHHYAPAAPAPAVSNVQSQVQSHVQAATEQVQQVQAVAQQALQPTEAQPPVAQPAGQPVGQVTEPVALQPGGSKPKPSTKLSGGSS